MRVPFGQTALRFLIGQKTSRFQFLTNYQTQSTEKADRFQFAFSFRGVADYQLHLHENCKLKMENFESEIDGMVRVGFTHEEISQYLRIILPSQRGLSARSVRRFCAARGIRFRSLLDTASLDCLIQSRVSLVGHSYGRRGSTVIHGQGTLRHRGRGRQRGRNT